MGEVYMAYLGIAILGWLGGVVINYLADVLPVKRALVMPYCATCGNLQPLASYLFYPRRCGRCGHYRSLRSWLLELFFVGITLWLWNAPPPELGFWLGWILLVYFGLVVVIDLEHRLILHSVSLVGIVLGFGLGALLRGWKSTLIGGVSGFLVMLVLYFFGAVLMKWLANRRGKDLQEEALGFGDVNLGGVLGLLLGWPGVIIGLVFAILLAGVVSLFYLLVMLTSGRYRMDMAIPYGPFMVGGAIILLYFRGVLLAYGGW